MDNNIGNTSNTPNNPVADTPQAQDKDQLAQQKGFASYEEYQAEKDKYTGKGFNGGAVKMVHWYKEHPEEINEIMFDGAEHDLEWYQQHAGEKNVLLDLISDYLEHQDSQASQSNNPNQDIKLNRVEIGDITIKKIEQNFSDFKQEKLDAVEEKLNELRPQIAELYARDSRLIKGRKNHDKFVKIIGEYGGILNDYLRLKAKSIHEQGKHANDEKLGAKTEELIAEIEQKLTEFAGGDLEHTEKTQEEITAEKSRLQIEAEQKLNVYFNDINKDLKIDVNAEFLMDFVKEDRELRQTINHQLDEGNICRKFVSKALNNRAVRGTLAAAAAAGLIVTGGVAIAGLATGTMTVGFGGFGLGTAIGAINGGVGGFIMSRRDSRNSVINRNGDEEGILSKEEIINQLKGIDVTNSNADVSNTTDLLLEKLYSASLEDTKNNRKRTLVATGLGAAIGGIMGSLSFGTTKGTEMPTDIKSHTNPVQYGGAEKAIGEVNVPKGKGLFEVFRQMGGQDAKQQQALDIARSITSKYSNLPSGADGLAEIYQGPISAWPDTAQSYITEISEAWANADIIPREIIGGGDTVFNWSTDIVTDYIPNAFMSTITRLTSALGGALGGVVANAVGNRKVASSRGSKVITATQSPQTPPAPTTNTAGAEDSPNPVPGEMTGDVIDLVVSNILGTFETYSKKEQEEIMDAISGDTLPALLSPSVRGLVAKYNSAAPEVKIRIAEGMLDMVKKNQSVAA